MLWFDPDSGEPQFWVDMRCYFGDRIMVHKFSRVSNFIVYCATEKVWAREDHTHPAEPELQQWIARRKKAMPEAEQSSLMYAAMYISTQLLFWATFLHLGAWRLGSKDLGCGAG